MNNNGVSEIVQACNLSFFQRDSDESEDAQENEQECLRAEHQIGEGCRLEVESGRIGSLGHVECQSEYDSELPGADASVRGYAHGDAREGEANQTHDETVGVEQFGGHGEGVEGHVELGVVAPPHAACQQQPAQFVLHCQDGGESNP